MPGGVYYLVGIPGDPRIREMALDADAGTSRWRLLCFCRNYWLLLLVIIPAMLLLYLGNDVYRDLLVLTNNDLKSGLTVSATKVEEERNVNPEVELKRWWENLTLEYPKPIGSYSSNAGRGQAARMQRICTQSQLPSYPANMTRIFLDPKQDNAYCFPPKVGSTNFKRMLVSLSKKYDKQTDLELIPVHDDDTFREYGYEPVVRPSQISSSGSLYHILFTRHPFHRLVSCYDQKVDVLQEWLPHLRAELATSNSTARFSWTGPESRRLYSFAEFVEFILDMPTHLSKFGFPRHWLPVAYVCWSCHVPYDYIAHLEYIEDDLDDLKSNRHLANNAEYPSKRRLAESEDSLLSDQRSQNVREHLETLSNDLLRRLIFTYRYDFILFGYSPFIY